MYSIIQNLCKKKLSHYDPHKLTLYSKNCRFIYEVSISNEWKNDIWMNYRIKVSKSKHRVDKLSGWAIEGITCKNVALTSDHSWEHTHISSKQCANNITCKRNKNISARNLNETRMYFIVYQLFILQLFFQYSPQVFYIFAFDKVAMILVVILERIKWSEKGYVLKDVHRGLGGMEGNRADSIFGWRQKTIGIYKY